jgi:predicted PhzF superfamily epimerase YddE/YHI9
MPIPLYQVDAFTAEPFSGNPAAVCLLDEPKDAAWMQSVAREMNLSETAFLVPQAGGWNLRWFTPAVEVALCGHATLATAHVLFERGTVAAGETARFATLSGALLARRSGEWIELDFPAKIARTASPPDMLLQSLGVEALSVWRNEFDFLVELDGEEAVRAVRPDFALLASIPVRGVIVTSAASTPGFDFVSRFFAPAVGVPEDPVTGSAHCCLGPWWQQKTGRDSFVARQLSARGGTLRVRVEGERVLLAGQAVTVLSGVLV